MNALHGKAFILSIVGLTIAAVVFGTTLVDAVILDETATPVALDAIRSEDTSSPSRFSEAAEPDVSFETFQAAVAGDPFQPNRTAPSVRYRLPGTFVESAPRPEAPRIEPPALRVVGSAVIGSGGLALVQVDSERPIAVGVGESIQGYRVASVRADGATLVGPAGRLSLAITEPLASSDSGNRGRDSRADTQELEAAERLQQLLEQVRGGRAGFQRGDFQRGNNGRGGRGGGRGGGGGDGGGSPSPGAS